MNKGAFHSSGRLDVQMLINRFRVQRFVFLADSTPFNITSFTWQLNIKANEGAYSSLLTLSTGGNGLSFPIYETNVLEARFQASQVNKPNIDEGCFYWELVRTDTNEIWVSGRIEFKYGLLDSSGMDQDVTVGLSNETVTVELSAIVQVNEGGGASITPVTDFSMTSSLPAAPNIGGRRRIILAFPYTPVLIGNVTYYHKQIIEYTQDGYWIRYDNATSDQ